MASDRETRRLTLLDVMILVAAVAIALGVSRAFESGAFGRDNCIETAWALLTASSWACLILRMKRPRPGLRRLASRPGDAACMASALTTVLTGAVCLAGSISREYMSRSAIDFSDAPVFGVVATPAAVMACWSMMALGRRWRSEVDWIGRLGRYLAVGWFLTVFAAAALL